MAPLAVDPQALSGAGAAVISVGDGVAAALGPLTSGFGANTGQDAAGELFGLAYQDSAKNLLKAVAAGINACRVSGFKVQVSASNYSRAEAASTLGGGGAVLAAPSEPGKFDAPGAPWTLGPGTPEPALWAVVEAFVGDLWPNGNPAQMHAAAQCWRTFGAALHGVKGQLHGPTSVVAAQQIPEGGRIQEAFSRLGDDVAKVGDECDKLAKGLDDFANEVQHAQDAIRDLLHRLDTPSGLWHEVVEVFNGHGLDEIKKIANDIKAVLHNMKREADAKEQLFQQAMGFLDDCALALEQFANLEFTHFLGDDVGSAASFFFDAYIDTSEGILKAPFEAANGLSQLNPLRFAYDPEGALKSWQGLGKLAQAATNPTMIPSMFAQDPQGMTDMAKGLVDWKDWTSDRPLVGLGHNLFDIGTVVVPGLGEVGAATKGAEAAGAASRAADAADAAGTLGRDGRALGELGEAAGAGRASIDVTKTTSGLTKDLESLSGEIPKGDAPPGGRPSASPPQQPGELRVDTAPPVTSHPPADPPAAPGSGAPERSPAPAPSEHLGPPPPAQHLPSTTPQSAEPAPVHAPMSPGHISAQPPSVAADVPHPGPAPPADVAHFPADVHPPEPVTKLPGLDYPYPPRDALALLEHPEAEITRLADGGVPPEVLDGYDPLAGRTPEEFQHEFTVADADGNIRWDWDNQAPNHGFGGTPEEADHIPSGLQLDRVGPNGGAYMSPEGTPLAERAPAPGLASQYHSFEGTGVSVPPDKNWVVLHGPAKGAFGQPGGAPQWVVIDRTTGLEVPVEELIDEDMLWEPGLADEGLSPMRPQK
jgi:hypothetical protein